MVLDETFTNHLVEELGVEDLYDKKMEQVKVVFEKLNFDEIQLLELRFFEGNSFKEVGDILHITENLAKVKTYRLLGKMKKMMGR